MKSFEQLDQQLKHALSPTVEPSKALNEKIINQLKEKDIMKPVYKKRIASILIVASFILMLSTTVFAAWRLLGPKQVAEHLKDQTLAHAFEGENAIEINKSVVSGGYHFTLHGIVSGKDLSDFAGSAHDTQPDRTYAVVSIAKLDGSKMPASQDEEYGQVPFFISPLIKGQKPWQVNMASMQGGYSEFVIDGVMYRLTECDGVEMFSDRGLYLAISTSAFYDVKAFNYNEETGEISPKTDYKGANALFDLPLDITKADHDKAEKYLQELLKGPEEDAADNQEITINWEEELANGVVIPESIKEVTYDEDGFAWYEYEGQESGFNVEMLFGEFHQGDTAVTKNVSINESECEGDIIERIAFQLSRDTEGVITGRLIKLK